MGLKKAFSPVSNSFANWVNFSFKIFMSGSIRKIPQKAMHNNF
jgi:hypothetical protein